MTDATTAGEAPPPTFIITGPTSGLGRALVAQILPRPFPLILVGRDLKRLDRERAQRSSAATVECIEIDFASDLKNLVDQLICIVQRVARGPLVFISNAGLIEPIGQAGLLELAAVERSMRVNWLSPMFVANALGVSACKQDNTLLVVDVSSGAATRPVRGWQAYCASKAAIKMALDVLAQESAHVEVIHLDPGVMDTPMQALIRKENAENMPDVSIFRGYKATGKLRDPHSVANEMMAMIIKRVARR